MKKVILVIVMSVFLLSVHAQKITDSTDHIVKKEEPQKMFYTIWPEKIWQELLELIKTADEKPSKVKQWNDLIMQSVRLYEKSDTIKPKK